MDAGTYFDLVMEIEIPIYGEESLSSYDDAEDSLWTLGYAAPYISGLVHDGCESVNNICSFEYTKVEDIIAHPYTIEWDNYDSSYSSWGESYTSGAGIRDGKSS